METERNEGRGLAPVIYLLLIVAVGLAAFNQYQISTIPAASSTTTSVTGASVAKTGDPIQDAIKAVIPIGVAAYSEGDSLSFDKPTESLDKLVGYDKTISFDSMTAEQQKRYGEIATTQHTACEYCCGIGSRGFGTKEGKLLCGCAHNIGFSGLTKYLLTKYGDKYTNEQIIQELQKWKATFFPQQSVAKYLEQQVKEGKIDPSLISQLPGQVGGC